MILHRNFRHTKITIKFLSLAGLFFLPLNLNAQTFNYQGRVDFNVHLQSVSSDWHYDNNKRRSRIGRAGFGWSETLNSYLSGGLLLGYLDLSQADNPVNAGQFSSGYYSGLQLDGMIIDADYLSLKLNLSFLYNSTQNYDGDQRINNVWMQSQATLAAKIPFGERIGIRLAANIYNISGEQRNSGPVSGVNRFSDDISTGYSAGIDVVVDRGASIGFDWLAGNREGGRIYFRRRF